MLLIFISLVNFVIFYYILQYISIFEDSSVGKRLRYGMHDLGIGVRLPLGAIDISLLHTIYTHSGVP
jgi:hypothetical protein